ncbi:hypothetical protein B0A78_07820 [Flavobacterium columnare NBRC 100251 = ATCC 23463]|uniref:Uncharacterized protein n=2 Tax=Flavobacterium columnare TaxID=996 RepID=G8X6P0_FLACA|nr:hypothetical protein [Flavobacterium columnare]AEW85625.1 hypothetical protein FCOL_03925 [Flavobacterium columnare ATCC 49512]ANO47447.1 hypothetical protein Pf1_01992 [Flavobacterium columnare]APT21910.1 hypothetical protein BU993_04210 [Flavobacterium columnare]AUX18906.1 hypothetical protein AQ623_11955 [Flavobacterium columnare]MEB3801934.1 hypothetical protein [Flavobacterium columnare]
MKKSFLLSSLIGSTLLIGCSKENNTPTPNLEITFPTGKLAVEFSHPESILFDGKEYFYISDIGAQLAPHVKDGDGMITKVDINGKLISKNISKTSLNAPKGSVLIGNTLWVNDIDELKGIDINTGELIDRISFSDLGIDLTVKGGTGLNDLVKGNDNSTLYASITNNGGIYKINLKEKTKEKIGENNFANGLFLKDNTLWNCAFTNGLSLKKLDLSSKINTDAVNSPNALGGLDGIAIINNDIYLSDWGKDYNGSNETGFLFKYNPTTQKSEEVDLASKIGKKYLNGPADISSYNNYLLIPAMGEGAIYIIKL